MIPSKINQFPLYFLRRIISILLKYFPSEKFRDILLWPVSRRLFGKGYTEIVSIKPGLSMKVYGDMEDMVNKLLLFTSEYMPLAWEPGTARLVEKLAPQSKCSVVTGSHIGYYPLILSFVNSKSVVYAFEPNPLNRERCQENINLSKLTNIKVLENALGNTIGQEKMYFDFGQSSLIDTHRLHAGEGMVNVTTLDEFFKDKNVQPDLIILDAEGYEPNILEGGKEMLAKYHPTIIFELNQNALKTTGSSPESLCNVFLDKGYSLFIINEGSHGITYNPALPIRLVPYNKFGLGNMSFLNIFATIDTEKIQQYVGCVN